MAHRLHTGVSELRTAGIKRKADAKKLLASREDRHARGSGYLAGYAIECKLKSVAMEIYSCRTLGELVDKLNLPDHDIYTHGLEALAMRLPSRNRFKQSDVWRDFVGQVNRWRPSWRYDPRDWTHDRAEAFMKAVDRVFHWIEANN